jgi:hypothetical protein
VALALAAVAAVNLLTGGSPDPVGATLPPPVRSAAQTASLRVDGVTSTRYAIAFELSVHNAAPQTLTVVRVVAPGLSFAVNGGVPVALPTNSGRQLHVRGELPACAGLPPAAEPGVPQFGAIRVELRDPAGRLVSVPFGPAELVRVHDALVGLRTRICPPGSYRLHPPG